MLNPYSLLRSSWFLFFAFFLLVRWLAGKGGFSQYPFFVRFLSVFFAFLLLREKVCNFSSAVNMSISALTRQSHTRQKFSEIFFCKGVQLYFEISLLSFIHKIFEQNFLSICYSLLSADMDL